MKDKRIEKYLSKEQKRRKEFFDSLPETVEEYKKKWAGYKKDTSWLEKYIKYDLNKKH